MLHNTYERGEIRNLNQKEVENVFREAYENGLQVAREGKCADYIPELDKADPGAFGIYVLDGKARSLAFEDVDTRFSIQSISKVINLAVSLKYRGFRGGLTCAVRGPYGIGLYGPALDQFGNSVAAVAAMEHISHRLGLHVFEYA